MFLSLAKLFGADHQRTAREDVFLVHPLQLSRWLDEAWAAARGRRLSGTDADAAVPRRRRIIETLDLPAPRGTPPLRCPPASPRRPGRFSRRAVELATARRNRRLGLLWHHLVYAYLIESTGVFEVLAEVVRRLVVGETLRPAVRRPRRWAAGHRGAVLPRPAAVLHRRDGQRAAARPPGEPPQRLLADVRPRAAAPDARRWPPAPARPRVVEAGHRHGVNTGFREKWTELLRQVWLGIENPGTGSGPTPPTASYIALLCGALKDMLAMRRRGGLLAREEFAYVSALSWFHLTLRTDTPIVQSTSTPPAPARPSVSRSSRPRGDDAGSPVPRAVRARRADVGAAAGHRARALLHDAGPRRLPRPRAPPPSDRHEQRSSTCGSRRPASASRTGRPAPSWPRGRPSRSACRRQVRYGPPLRRLAQRSP